MVAERLYNRRMWEVFYLYRASLVTIRIVELAFIIMRLLFVRGPILVVWTRLPGLRDRKPPHPNLAAMVAPARDRPSLLLHEITVVTPGECRTKEELATYFEAIKKEVTEPRPTAKTIAGGMIRGVFTEMGPTFIKLAQLVSMRPEAPPFLREELQLLQDRIPPLTPEHVRKHVDREMKKLGTSRERVFEWIAEKPIGSASLSQVNRAKLRRGEEVAIKIQRPYLEAITTIDTVLIVEILLERLVKLIPQIRNVDLAIFNISFRGALRREIDFYLEARTQSDMKDLFATMPHFADVIKISKPYLEYTTDKLLTMELITHLCRIDRPLDMGLDKYWDLMQVKLPGYPEHFEVHMFRCLSAAIGDMSMAWGWWHADPHLGNLYWIEPHDGEGWRIFMCDFGMMEECPREYVRWQTDMHSAWMWRGGANDQSTAQLIWMLIRYFDPDHVILPILIAAPYAQVRINADTLCSAKLMDQFMTFPPGKMFIFIEHLIGSILKRRISEERGVEEGDTSYYMQTRTLGGSTWSREVLESIMVMLPKMLAGLLPPGVYMKRILPHYAFMWWKNQLYNEEISSTLWIGASWNDSWMHGLKERMKERIRWDLNRGNIIDLGDYIENMTEIMARPDIGALLGDSSEKPK